jgi:membrane protein
MTTLLERLESDLFVKSRTLPAPWGPVLRTLRYPAALTRDWLAGEINVRAMSLAYTTLLSLVPLMVFSFSILKGFGARSDLKLILHEFFKPLGAAANELTESVLQFVTNMRGDVLGSIGLITLTYTVISTIQKVEASFNFVWRVGQPRSLARRLTEYLSVMIFGPILLAVALELLSSAQDSSAAHWLDSVASFAWLLSALGHLLPYVIVTIVFTAVYALVPNTRVHLRPALIGGVTAGIAWALVGKIFAALIVYSSQLIAIYTGFAIVLATLIWVYLSWLILLLGAQLAFYVQFPQYLRGGREPAWLTGSAREAAALALMVLIGRDYRAGATRWTANSLAAEIGAAPAAVAPLLDCLRQAGLLARTDKQRWLPARDPAGIALSAIIEAVRAPSAAAGERPGGASVAPAARIMEEIEAAVRQKLGARSLADLLAAL